MLTDLSFLSNDRRAWLNGFVSGFLGIEPTLFSDDALAAAGLTTATVIRPPEPQDEAFPWHQPELPILSRIEMADGKPLKRQLMAAMAQLDCGSCGYLCKSYSEAIAAGVEPDLSLCTPGGKETKQMLKKLLKQNGGIEPTESPSTVSHSRPGIGRNNPFPAELVQSKRLNAAGSSKDTRQVIIDLSGSELAYNVGDALGVWPTNCDELVQAILKRTDGNADELLTTPLGNHKPIAAALRADCCLKDPTDELLQSLIQRAGDNATKRSLQQLLDEGVPNGFDVLDALELAPSVRLQPSVLVDCLESIKPRLYSIASSMKAVGDRVHLTVGKVSHRREGRLRRGAASTLFAERLQAGDRVHVFVQRNQTGFTVPSDSSLPMIMIGPGTGIAPFIAFLQERAATKASGKNWLFFGDQHQATDFLYESELKTWYQTGLLTHLSTAFSRDTDEKVYVQDRMLQCGADLWQWICEGAAIFVCGDASRMAADVERALIHICQTHGKMDPEQATAYVVNLSEKKRYVRDVY